MQINPFDIVDWGQEHHKEMLRQAHNERLARSARAERPALHYTLMAWTGRRLMDAGRYLTSAAENKEKQHAVQLG